MRGEQAEGDMRDSFLECGRLGSGPVRFRGRMRISGKNWVIGM